jgi:hypothetical protein
MILASKINPITTLKGQYREMVFFAHSILSRIERKDLVPKFTELWQDLTHLAHKENTQRYFPVGQAKIFYCILFSWGSDIISRLVKILTLRSPHKLLKKLGALSEYAKCSQSSLTDETIF